MTTTSATAESSVQTIAPNLATSEPSGHPTEVLGTGRPQSEIKSGAPSFFEGVYSDPERLQQFLTAMQGIPLGSFNALVETIDFRSHVGICKGG